MELAGVPARGSYRAFIWPLRGNGSVYLSAVGTSKALKRFDFHAYTPSRMSARIVDLPRPWDLRVLVLARFNSDSNVSGR